MFNSIQDALIHQSLLKMRLMKNNPGDPQWEEDFKEYNEFSQRLQEYFDSKELMLLESNF